MTANQYNPHISIDCVVLGFDGEQLNVLLVEKTGVINKPGAPGFMKLPGRNIFMDEDPDEAAADVLTTMTGIKNPDLQQFKTFGNPERTSNEEDRKWSEGQCGIPIGRVITTAYISVLKISTHLKSFSTEYNARWWPIATLPRLVFDHNEIVEEALEYLRRYIHFNPALLFSLLPQKFTALELRKLYENIYRKSLDVRNFYKKMGTMPYVKVLEEKQNNVAHRAARYYRFDKKSFNKLYKNT